MSVKKTRLLVTELRMMADFVFNKYCREILIEAAERLEDTDKIAEFYRKKAENQNKVRRGKGFCKMRTLTKKQKIKRGCEYCLDYKRRQCKHKKCPYHELDGFEKFTDYLETKPGIDIVEILRGLCGKK